jgi:hypothetical protein
VEYPLLLVEAVLDGALESNPVFAQLPEKLEAPGFSHGVTHNGHRDTRKKVGVEKWSKN